MPDLGKYAAEVLGAYGLSLGLIAVLLLVTLKRGKKARAALRQIEETVDRNGKN
ncbi:MAG: heme exporter protein CcmD [Sulfitobacter sp.]